MGTHPGGGSRVGGVGRVNWLWYGWVRVVRARLNDYDKNIVVVVSGPQVREQWGWGADRT